MIQTRMFAGLSQVMPQRETTRDTRASVITIQGSYSNKEMKFQYIPVYSRMDRTQFPGHFLCGISHKRGDHYTLTYLKFLCVCCRCKNENVCHQVKHLPQHKHHVDTDSTGNQHTVTMSHASLHNPGIKRVISTV